MNSFKYFFVFIYFVITFTYDKIHFWIDGIKISYITLKITKRDHENPISFELLIPKESIKLLN